MTLYIANAPALSMPDRLEQVLARCEWDVPQWGNQFDVARIPRPVEDPADLVAAWEEYGAEIVSIIGHADTARVISSILGRELTANRVSIKLARDELVLVGQFMCPRLPEGATEPPKDATIEWWII